MEKIQHIVRRMVPALAAVLIVPTASRAGHDLDHRALQPTARSLRCAVEEFERLAWQRPLPRHVHHLARLLSQKACRFADSVEAFASYGRIRGDFYAFRGLSIALERQLQRTCGSRYDATLQHAWQAIVHSGSSLREEKNNRPAPRSAIRQ